jgi:hypothetical protein
MVFKTNYSHELFNDCLFFREEARTLLSGGQSNERVFEVRRAIRASLISLWNFWEYWINNEVISLTDDRVMKMKGVTSLEDHEIASTVQQNSLVRLPFDTKLDLFILLTGIDARREKKLMARIEKMKSIRNELVHPSRKKPFFPEKYISNIDEGIETTRLFFRILTQAKRYLPATFGYLADEKPRDLRALGYGHFKSKAFPE